MPRDLPEGYQSKWYLPFLGHVAVLIAELFRKGDLLKIVVFLKENIGF